MNIDLEAVSSAMIGAARAAIADRWPAARALAEAELRKLAGTFADVQNMLAGGTIDQTGARRLIRMQENSARSILRMVEGVSVLTSRRVLTAAMGAAATLVNPILGFTVVYGEHLLLPGKPQTPASPSSNPPKKQKAVAATRATGRAVSTAAASSEPAEEATPSFKAGKDL
jgi:hypothetical protein